jgi:beta-glucosidase
MDHKVTIYEGLKAALGEGVEILLETKDFGGEGLRKAAEADLAIVVAGNIASPCLDVQRGGAEIGWSHSMIVQDGMEDVDRQSLVLPHEDIVKLVMGVNPRTVLLMVTTFPYAIRWSKDHVPAIVQCTHSSEELGNGVADVLLGKVNPAGRLTQTWPERIEDLPPIMDFDLTKGRTYMYAKAKPLFPFGHGLSYTRFNYSGLKVSAPEDGVVRVSVDVTNTGAVDGDEVVQLYLQYPRTRPNRPERQLRGFRRVFVPAGQTVCVEIPIAVDDLKYWSETTRAWTLAPGRYRFLAGASSADIRCRKSRRIQ